MVVFGSIFIFAVSILLLLLLLPYLICMKKSMCHYLARASTSANLKPSLGKV